MLISLSNSFGHTIETKVGFSWTVFFFGFWVPLFRKDWKMFFLMLFLSFALNYIYPNIGFIISMTFSLFYNEMYIKSLLAKGYKPTSSRYDDLLVSKGFYNNN